MKPETYRCRTSYPERRIHPSLAVATNGFTLIELMIVVIIIAILTGIAYPSYVNYTKQARRSDAQAGLTQVANQLEKYFTQCNSYIDEVKNDPVLSTPERQCPDGTNPGLGLSSDLSPDGHYRLVITADNISGSCATGSACASLSSGAKTACVLACGYTITADPNGTGTTGRQHNNGSLRIDSRGIKQWDKLNNGTFTAKWTDK